MKKIVFILILFIQTGFSQTDLLKTLSGYVNPEELITLSESIPFDKAIEMLSTISEKLSGKKIISNADFKDPIGIRIEKLPFKRALTIIVQYNNLMFEENASVIVVQKKTTKADGKSTTTYVPIEGREVRISAIFFEANITEMNQRGINWEFLLSGKGVNIGNDLVNFGVTNANATASANLQSQGKAPGNTTSLKTAFDIGSFSGTANAAFRFFENENLGELIAKPSITVRDGIEGRIQIGSDITLKTKDFSGNIIDNLIPTGTIIKVTPHLHNEDNINYILLKIDAQRSSSSGDISNSEIRKTQANTEVLMLDGEETIIGGLYVNEESTVRSGIPILKDLPWWVLGLRYLTGYESRTIIKKEIIILIKAEIVPTLKERVELIKKENLVDEKFKNDEIEAKKFKIHSFQKKEEK